MKIIKISQTGIELIKSFEGFKGMAYKCPAGVPTIGYGTIRYPDGHKVKLGDVCTEQSAQVYLHHDLVSFELAVDALCRDDINQNQFDSLVSFCYNLGASNLKVSTLLKKVNIDPNDPTIRAEFLKWNKGGGHVLSGLTRRRSEEATLYFL